MPSSLLSRLPQLRQELESCPALDAHLSVLLALRRELARYYQTIPVPVLHVVPTPLRHQAQQSLRALTAPAPFHAPSWEAQYAQTEQALTVLEQLAPQVSRPLVSPVRSTPDE